MIYINENNITVTTLCCVTNKIKRQKTAVFIKFKTVPSNSWHECKHLSATLKYDIV